MPPDVQQPVFSSFPEPPPQKSRKKLIIIIAVIVVLIAVVAAYFAIAQSRKSEDKTDNIPVKNTGLTVQFGTSKDVVGYAGNKMYDACNLIPVSLFKTHIGKFEETFNSMSSDNHLKNPLMIDHGYVDRSIQNILGKDNIAEEPSTTISTTGIDSTVRSKSFISITDSHCTYAQGANFDSEFGDIYIIQPPQPLHPKLIAYLDDLKQKGKMAAETQGVQVYVEPVRKGDDSYTSIFRKGNVVVFMNSLQLPLIQAAVQEIVNVLAKEPTGPATITYPPFYSKLTNTCDLFPASDFERLLGKPASSLSTESWAITESEEDTAMRECSRIEVERLKQGEISSTRIGLSESRTEEQTKNRLANIKSDKHNTVTPLKDLGDEAYAVARDTTANAQYSIVIRSGKVLLTIESSGETKDADTNAFMSRTLPIAKTAFSNYKK